MSQTDADRIETLRSLADEPPLLRLPPESAQTLCYIEAQISHVLACDAADPLALLPLGKQITRAGILDFCLTHETREAAKVLAAHMKTPFLDGPKMIFEMN